ncbi:MAG: DUF423 domain-containing protein [Acidobacteriota bacterium]|nr:MAG: DUF423 domain-containing protein [Acidobacteriota bacterium]
MSEHWMITTGAIAGLLAVAAGAFGAHALEEGDARSLVETGARYHMYHALALVLLGVFPLSPGHSQKGQQRRVGLRGRRALRLAASCFVLGIVVFAGTLYLMAGGGPRWLGAVTPIGGVAFLLGWALVAYVAIRSSAAHFES